MKQHLLLTAGILCSAWSWAESIEVADIQFADKVSILTATQAVGELSGNPMVGAMMIAQMAQTDIPRSMHMMVEREDLNGPLEKLLEKAKWVTVPVSTNAPPVALKEDLARLTLKASLLQCPELKGISSLVLAVRLNEKHLDLLATVHPTADSDLAQFGKSPLAAQPFAFAKPDVIYALSYAPKSGVANFNELYDAVLQVLKKYNVQTKFLEVQRDAGLFCATLDFPALTAYMKGEGKATFEKIDPDVLMDDLRAVVDLKTTVQEESPKFSASLALKNYTPKYNITDRLEATFSEAKTLPVYAVAAISPYTLIKAMLPQLLAQATEADAVPLKVMIGSLPPEGRGAIVMAQWREDEALHYQLRISADEARGLCAFANLMMATMLMNSCDEDDDCPAWDCQECEMFDDEN